MAEPKPHLVQIKVLGEATGGNVVGIPIRDERGRYTSAQAEQFVRNQLFGEALREQVGRRIQNRVSFGKRAAASTGTLLKASVDVRNTKVTKEFVGIGIPTWLNTRARYWRTFELGSLEAWGRPFVGTQLYPFGGKSGFVPHGATPGLRTSRAAAREDGRFVVKHEIQGAYIYRDVFESYRGEIRTFYSTSTRRFLNEVFGAGRVIRGAG